MLRCMRIRASWIIIVLLLASNIFFGYLYFSEKYKPRVAPSFNLISEDIAWMESEEFIQRKQYYHLYYGDLRKELTEYINHSNATYGIYFEDLTTGSWMGINERQKFYPQSLLKMPVLVAVLKKVEEGSVSLSDKLTLRQEDINTVSGSLGYKGAGYTLTVKELLIYLIKESDNTAVLTLQHQLLTPENLVYAYLGLGLPLPDANAPEILSAKEYSNTFRSLYLSAYLRRTFSELALTLMLETDFNAGLPAGLPRDVKIAHKVGFYYEEGYIHDCGIIYAENNPYLLCVMSQDNNREEAETVFPEISKMVYSYVSKSK